MSVERIVLTCVFAIVGLLLLFWAYGEHGLLSESTERLANQNNLPDKYGNVPDGPEMARDHFRSYIGPIIFRYVMGVLFLLGAWGVFVSKFSANKNLTSR